LLFASGRVLNELVFNGEHPDPTRPCAEPVRRLQHRGAEATLALMLLNGHEHLA
jgi:hypothetical protein